MAKKKDGSGPDGQWRRKGPSLAVFAFGCGAQDESCTIAHAVGGLVGHCVASRTATVGDDCEVRGERAISIGVPVGVVTGWLVERRLKQRVLVYAPGNSQATDRFNE
jgi:hypothetical protein